MFSSKTQAWNRYTIAIHIPICPFLSALLDVEDHVGFVRQVGRPKVSSESTNSTWMSFRCIVFVLFSDR